jgi:hypothetical protein
MTDDRLRHRCRNAGHCGQKLPEPVDSARKAFCCRGCYDQFHRRRCVVCEKAKPNVNARVCGRRPCKAELRKWPALYVFRAEDSQSPTAGKADVRSAHSTGVKTRSATRRAPLNLLGGYRFPNAVKVEPDLLRQVVETEARIGSLIQAARETVPA